MRLALEGRSAPVALRLRVRAAAPSVEREVDDLPAAVAAVERRVAELLWRGAPGARPRAAIRVSSPPWSETESAGRLATMLGLNGCVRSPAGAERRVRAHAS